MSLVDVDEVLMMMMMMMTWGLSTTRPRLHAIKGGQVSMMRSVISPADKGFRPTTNRYIYMCVCVSV
jgi:hypothetical protein